MIMRDLVSSESFEGKSCVSEQSYEEMERDGKLGCGTPFAYVYFITFMILLSMVAMNLSVAAVIDGLNAARKEESAMIARSSIDQLYTLWSIYDPKATGWISVEDMLFLFYELKPPLGLGFEIPDRIKDQEEEKLNLRVRFEQIVI